MSEKEKNSCCNCSGEKTIKKKDNCTSCSCKECSIKDTLYIFFLCLFSVVIVFLVVESFSMSKDIRSLERNINQNGACLPVLEKNGIDSKFLLPANIPDSKKNLFNGYFTYNHTKEEK